MSAASVSIDRASLALSPLVIGGDAAANWFLDEEGLGAPDMQWRFGSAPDSADIHGREIVSAALEQSSLELRVWVQGATASALAANVAALRAALAQFTYETTVTVDGVSQVWVCDPGSSSLPIGVRAPYADALLQQVAVSIPVYPIPGSV